MKLLNNKFRKACRKIHRDLSYIFTGMLLIYAISGIVLNHRDTFNPKVSITQNEFKLEDSPLSKSSFSKERVLKMLEPFEEEGNYTKHYFPEEDKMKVFLKGGSNIYLDLNTGKGLYEKVTPRPLIGPLTRLHYNPGKWWTIFADIFGGCLIIIVLSGIWMVHPTKREAWIRKQVEIIIGFLIPLIFLLFFL